MENENFWFAIFALTAGVYLFYAGIKKVHSKKSFLKEEGMPATDIEKEYRSIPQGDILNERYLHPIGWILIGVAFVGIGIYLLFF